MDEFSVHRRRRTVAAEDHDEIDAGGPDSIGDAMQATSILEQTDSCVGNMREVPRERNTDTHLALTASAYHVCRIHHAVFGPDGRVYVRRCRTGKMGRPGLDGQRLWSCHRRVSTGR